MSGSILPYAIFIPTASAHGISSIVSLNHSLLPSVLSVRGHVWEKGKAEKIGLTGTALDGTDGKEIQYVTSVELRRMRRKAKKDYIVCTTRKTRTKLEKLKSGRSAIYRKNAEKPQWGLCVQRTQYSNPWCWIYPWMRCILEVIFMYNYYEMTTAKIPIHMD